MRCHGRRLAAGLLTLLAPLAFRTALADERSATVAPADGEEAREASAVEAPLDVPRKPRTSSPQPAARLKSLTRDVAAITQLFTMKDLIAPVPVGRDLASVYTIAVGVSDGGDPVLGDGNASISGASGLENLYRVEGVDLSNAGYGALGTYSVVYGALGNGITRDLLETVRVDTGGIDSSVGQFGGGVVEAELRSGSNVLALEAALYEDVGSFEGARNDRLDSPNVANAVEARRRELVLSVGGPIVRDRLFYFAAFNPIRQETDFKLTSGDGEVVYCLEGDTNGDGFCGSGDSGVATFPVGVTITGGRTPPSVTRERSIDNYAAKLSWFVTNDHKLELAAFGDPSEGEIGPQSPKSYLRVLTDPITTPDPDASATGLDWGGDQISLRYTAVWTPALFTVLQLSRRENELTEIGPGVSRRAIFDEDRGVFIGGAGFYEEARDEVTRFSFENVHVLGPVEVRYGLQLDDIEWSQPAVQSGPTYAAFFPNLVELGDGGGTTFGFSSACEDPTVTYDPACYTRVPSTTGAAVIASGLTNPPFVEYRVTRSILTDIDQPTSSEERSAFLQAAWDATPRLSVKAGLRWTEQELTGAGTQSLPFSLLPDGSTAGGSVTELTARRYEFDAEVAPSLGLSWDVRGDGRHRVLAGWAEYLQRVPSQLAVRGFSNEVRVTDERFTDASLSVPVLDSICPVDTDGDGIADGSSPCHTVRGLVGLRGGGSIILDGTQRDPGSEVYTALNGWHVLTTGAATRLPSNTEWLAGYARQVGDYMFLEVRHIHREPERTIHDVQFASNEQLWNLLRGASGNGAAAFGDPFPGHGAASFGSYVFANPGSNVDRRLFPVPERDYAAWELVYHRRFHRGWMAYANYRFASLEGNYEGHFRNDNGATDPFFCSQFDFPAVSAVDSAPTIDGDGDGFADNDFDTFVPSRTLAGQYRSGPLNTERRHVFNGFASRQFDFGLSVGGRISVASGQPRTPLLAHPAYASAGEIPGSDPVYWWVVEVDTDPGFDSDGDGNPANDVDGRGFAQDPDPTIDPTTLSPEGDPRLDLDGDGAADVIVDRVSGPRLFDYTAVRRGFSGRTSTIVTFDIGLAYDLDLRDGKSRLTLLADVFNLFNENDPVRIDDNVETRSGRSNPDYLKPNLFHEPRTVRLGVRFSW